MKRWNREIGPAAEIALHRAGGDADDRGDDGQAEAEQHRDAEAVDQPRQHVAAAVVGAEPVVFKRAAFGEIVRGGEFAILRVEHPGRLRRERRRRMAHLRVVGKPHRRPDHRAAFLVDQTHQIVVAIVGRGAEQHRIGLFDEGGVGVGDDCRKVPFAVDADEDRLVVGDEVGEQRENEQQQKHPQRPVAAPVGLEAFPAPLVDRRNRDPAALQRHVEPGDAASRGAGGANVHL